MKKIIFLLLPLLFAFSCQDLSSIQPPDELDLKGQFGTFVDTVFYANKAQFEIDPKPATGNGKNLCTGNYQDFSSAFFIQFIGIPSDTIKIDSAYIELTTNGRFGTADEMLDLDVYLVDEEWDEHTVNTLPEFHSYQPVTMMEQIQVGLDDTLKVRIPLDTTIFNDWRYDTETNNGLYIRSTAALENHIREFESFEVLNDLDWPKIYFFYMDDTVSVKDSVSIGFDAIVFEYDSSAYNVFDPTPTDNYLLLASGLQAQIKVQFDFLKSLPKNMVIQSADLQLDVDDTDIISGMPENTLDNPNYGSGFYARSIMNTDSGLVVDSTFTTNLNNSFYMQQTDDKISMPTAYDQEKFGKNQIQQIINGETNSEWFLIQFTEEESVVSVLRLFGLEDPIHPNPIRMQLRYFEVTEDGF